MNSPERNIPPRLTVPGIQREQYRKNKSHPFLLSIVIIAILGGAIYLTFFQGIKPGPSFITTLQDEGISKNNVKAVRILKHTFTTWPFEESDYSQMPSVGVTNQAAIGDLLHILSTESSEGETPRNHPGTVYGGIFQIDSTDGRRFYIYYHLECDRRGYFVVLEANSANSTNPNGASNYENVALVKWLKQNDPWFESIESYPIQN